MTGGFLFCEYNSIQDDFPEFQQVLANLESKLISETTSKWAPMSFGGMTPAGGQFGRTTILPPLFNDVNGVQMATWRQNFTSTGHQTIMTGTRAGNTIPEDFNVGWIGLAFPNKEINVTELKWQIGDRKYGRINIEEMKSYNQPALVFEEGFIINEEESFELYAYVENTGYQRIVPLGFCVYKVINKVLGNPGAAI